MFGIDGLYWYNIDNCMRSWLSIHTKVNLGDCFDMINLVNPEKRRNMKNFLLISVVLVLLGLGFSIFADISGKKNELPAVKDKVVEYLTKTKGYAPDDYNLQISFHWDSTLFGYSPYMIQVEFKDEPGVKYYYTYRNGEVWMKGVQPSPDQDDKNLKHAE